MGRRWEFGWVCGGILHHLAKDLHTLNDYRWISHLMITIVIMLNLTICLPILEDSVVSQPSKEASEPLLPIHKGVIDAQMRNIARRFHHSSPRAFDILQAINSREKTTTSSRIAHAFERHALQ